MCLSPMEARGRHWVPGSYSYSDQGVSQCGCWDQNSGPLIKPWVILPPSHCYNPTVVLGLFFSFFFWFTIADLSSPAVGTGPSTWPVHDARAPGNRDLDLNRLLWSLPKWLEVTLKGQGKQHNWQSTCLVCTKSLPLVSSSIKSVSGYAHC